MFGLFKSKPQVLISGAGPVGLYAALKLAKRGVKVQVIEEEWRGTTRSYALALHSRSLELLDQLGLSDPLLSRARKLDKVGFYSGAERRAELDLSKLASPFPYIAILPQAELEDLLVKNLADEGVKVQYNHRLARIAPSANGVMATIDTLGKDTVGYTVSHAETIVEKSHKVEVPLLLAADGHRSLARTQSHIKFDAVRPADHFAVFEFEAGGETPDEVCVVLNDNSTNVLWPERDQRRRWSFQISELESRGDSRLKDRLVMTLGRNQYPHLEESYMKELVTERAPWFKTPVDAFDWRIEVRFEYRLASAFGSGRVWLAGDAAHMAGPVGMQSMNVGLKEVDALCDLYAGILDGSKSEADLAEYNAARLAEWHSLLDPDKVPVAEANANPWAVDHADRLRACIPASGEQLTALLGQFGLRPAS